MINFIFRIFKLKKITSRVFFLVALLIVLSGSMHLLAYKFIDLRVRVEDTRTTLTYSLLNQQRMLEHWAQDRAKEVRYLANMPATQSQRIDDMENIFQIYLQYHDELRVILFVDDEGYVRVNTDSPEINMEFADSMRDYEFFVAAQHGEDYMGQFVSRNEPAFIFSSPVYSELGLFQGVVLGAVHLKEIQQMLAQSLITDSHHFYIINQDLSIIARLTHPGSLNSINEESVHSVSGDSLGHGEEYIERLHTSLTEAILAYNISQHEWLITETNMMTYENHDDVEVFGLYIPIFQGKYYLINEMNKKDVLRSHNQIVIIMLSITLLIIGLGFLLLIPVSKHLLRPFFYLVKAMNRMKSGNYRSVLDIESFSNAPIELQKFLNMFNQMSVNIREHHDTLQELSSTDDLTGLANRRMFDQYLEREWAHAKRTQSCISIAFIDIDLFKQYNDTYGHQAGDECLMLVSDMIKKSIKRPRDLAVRYGGEEFVVILPDTCCKNARLVAERLRKRIEDLHLSSEYTINRQVTVSIGIATLTPTKSLTKESLIALADRALYEAKARGRNQIVAFDEQSFEIEDDFYENN